MLVSTARYSLQSGGPSAKRTHLTTAVLADPRSEASFPLGDAMTDEIAATLATSLGIAAGERATLCNVASKERIDGACRIMLRQMQKQREAEEGHAKASLQRLLQAARAPVAAASAVASAAVTAAAAAAIAAAPFRRTRVDGSNAQCLFLAIAEATGDTLSKQRERARGVLNFLTPQQCNNLDLFPSPSGRHADSADCSGARQDWLDAKAAYLLSEQHEGQRWGRTAEIELLALAYRGVYRIVVIDPDAPDAQRVRIHPTPFAWGNEELPASLAQQPAQHEITLLHCSAQGSERLRNHFDLIRHVQPNDTTRARHDIDPAETPEQQQQRYQALLTFGRSAVAEDKAVMAGFEEQAREIERAIHAEDRAEAARARDAAAHRAEAAGVTTPPRHAAAARRQHAPAAAAAAAAAAPAAAMSASPLRSPSGRQAAARSNNNTPAAAALLPTPPRQRGSRHPQQRAPSAAARAAFAAPPAEERLLTTPSSYTAPQTRPNVWREIPRDSRPLFLSIAEPFLQAYATYSEALEIERCAEVVHLLLDLPRQTLSKGTRARDIRRSLGEAMPRFVDALKAIRARAAGSAAAATAAATAAAAAAAVAIPSAAPASSHTDSIPTARPASTGTATRGLMGEEEKEESEEKAMERQAFDAHPDTQLVRAAHRKLQEGSVGTGCIRRAAAMLVQPALADITAETIDELRQLHPPAGRPMRAIPDNRALPLVAVDQSVLFQLLKHRVNNGAAPGPSGWTGSHLWLIAERGSQKARDGLTLLVRDICNGTFVGNIRQRLLSSVLTPVSKGAKGGVRPIAMGEAIVKLASHYCMRLIEKDMPKLFPRIQFGVNRAGGSETAAQLIRATLAQSTLAHPSTIAISTDFQNAFNEKDRANVWEALLDRDLTEPVWRMLHWSYSESSPLLVYDRRDLHTELKSAQGMRQGCPFGGFGFSLSVQPMYEAAVEGLDATHAVSIQDDLNLMGPYVQAFEAFDRVAAAAPSHSLQLRVDKCVVYLPPSLSAPDRAAVQTECDKRNLRTSDKLMSLGVMHGSDAEVEQHCMAKVDSHERFFDLLCHPAMPVQSGFTLLRYCALPRLGYLARTTPPDRLRAAAARFDAMALRCFHRLMQTDPTVVSPEMLHQMQLPLSAGGMGMRPVERTAATAYFASLAAMLPDLVQAFPSIQLRSSETYQQLLDCWRTMRQQGVGHSILPVVPDGYEPLVDMTPDVLARLRLSEPDEPPDPPDPALAAAAAAAAANTAAESAAALRAELRSNVSNLLARSLAIGSAGALMTAVVRQQQIQMASLLGQSDAQLLPIPPAAPAVAAPAAAAAAAAAPIPAPLLDRRSPAVSSSARPVAFPSDRDDMSGAVTTLIGGDELIDSICHKAVAWKKGDKPFMQAQQVQTDATEQLEERLLSQLKAASSPLRSTLLTAAGAPHASAWLTAAPTEPAYRLSDAAFRLATRHRLGLAPRDTMLLEECVCKRGTAFVTDPDHLHSCKVTGSRAATHRHDCITQVLYTLAREVGFQAVREPMDHIRPSDEARATHGTATATLTHQPAALRSNPARTSAPTSSPSRPAPLTCDDEDIESHYFRHADLLLTKHDKQLYIDVAVIRPTKASALLNCTAARNVALSATQPIARAKTRKYAAICKANRYTFVPFVVETYGGIGRQAEKLLDTLSEYATDRSKREFMQDAHTRIAVSLQQSNANLALFGQQRMHLKRRAVQPTRWQQRRVPSNPHPQDTDQLQQRLAPMLSAADSRAWDAHRDDSMRQPTFVYRHWTADAVQAFVPVFPLTPPSSQPARLRALAALSDPLFSLAEVHGLNTTAATHCQPDGAGPMQIDELRRQATLRQRVHVSTAALLPSIAPPHLTGQPAQTELITQLLASPALPAAAAPAAAAAEPMQLDQLDALELLPSSPSAPAAAAELTEG